MRWNFGAATLLHGILFFCLSVLQAAGEEPTVRTAAIIEAPAAAVWRACATAEGLRGWAYAGAGIELRVGGRVHFAPPLTIAPGDGATAPSLILAYDPERLLSWSCGKQWWVLNLFDTAPAQCTVELHGPGIEETTAASMAAGPMLGKLKSWCESHQETPGGEVSAVRELAQEVTIAVP
ncbi:SRPBCC domain-containing protein, partial [Candidatus Poribacteria bacterium]|nr:SRPBCC domain-containing protein [Candidatus Poribacteria bacterium]